jgi:hypothetical protein
MKKTEIQKKIKLLENKRDEIIKKYNLKIEKLTDKQIEEIHDINKEILNLKMEKIFFEKGKKKLCQYSDEETDAMTQEEIDKIPQCGSPGCFDCYGDSTGEY